MEISPRLRFDTMLRRVLLLFVFVITLAFAAPALAHRPMWGDGYGPIEVEDISISYAFYQTMKPDEIEVFYFEGQAGQNLHAGIQIPDNGKYEDYGVNAALFGPGLPKADEAILPPDHPEDLGAMVYESHASSNFFEPFTQTNYLGRQKIDMSLPADGTYYLLVWNPESVPGKYVIDFGYREAFTPLDIFLFPFWWLRVNWYFENYALTLVPLVLLSLLAAQRIRNRKPGVTKAQVSPV